MLLIGLDRANGQYFKAVVRGGNLEKDNAVIVL